MKKIFKNLLLILLLVLSISIFSCKKVDQKDIIILFTNDVHCGIEDGIGYAGVKAYKDEMKKLTDYVTLVDAGDHTQGSTLGTLTKGESLIKIMNAVGYDYAVFGNHEFDYGMQNLSKLINLANYKYLNCNIKYNGSNETSILDNTKPYEVVTYGKVKVAYIGLTTPRTIVDAAPTNFKENNEIVYDFGTLENNNDNYITRTQKAVNVAINAGADYCIAITHIGEEESGPNYTIDELVTNTTGIDFVFDAHSHSTINKSVNNKDGKPVNICQTGTKLANIGKLVIDKEGNTSLELVSDITLKDESITNLIKSELAVFDELLNNKIASSTFDLSISDSEGVRMVRNRETAIGNFCADAYRFVSGADIAYVNGGGVRADFKKGDITYGDVINVNPFGNMLCVINITGQEFLDILEYFYKDVQANYKENGKAVGENGSFANLSGVKVEIDTSIPTSVVLNENDMLVSVGTTRRVVSCKVLVNGEYVDIDPAKVYTFASHDYCIKKGGSGMELKLTDNELLQDSVMPDYQVLLTYMTEGLNGDLSAYSDIEGRIIIR